MREIDKSSGVFSKETQRQGRSMASIFILEFTPNRTNGLGLGRKLEYTCLLPDVVQGYLWPSLLPLLNVICMYL